jgi:hypothetical protein
MRDQRRMRSFSTERTYTTSTPPMPLIIQPYLEQLFVWPRDGRHILAQFDEDSVVVYQAYRPSIALHAIENQCFGGDFSFKRMSWIKPGFLWMMYRSGWATKEGQEYILAVRLRRDFFDQLLESAVAATFTAESDLSYQQWQAAVAGSDVLVQWDPDHDPFGVRAQRRALQIGLRGEALGLYARSGLLSIEDITPFVAAQRACRNKRFANLQTPAERLYVPASQKARHAIGIDK